MVRLQFGHDREVVETEVLTDAQRASIQLQFGHDREVVETRRADEFRVTVERASIRPRP